MQWYLFVILTILVAAVAFLLAKEAGIVYAINVRGGIDEAGVKAELANLWQLTEETGLEHALCLQIEDEEIVGVADATVFKQDEDSITSYCEWGNAHVHTHPDGGCEPSRNDFVFMGQQRLDYLGVMCGPHSVYLYSRDDLYWPWKVVP